MVDITNLVAYYKCDENAANTTVADSHSTHTGTASTNTANLSATGIINGCFDLNGSTERVSIADHDDFTLTSGYSMSFWFDADTVSGNHTLLSQWGSVDSWFIKIDDGRLAIFHNNGGSNGFFSPSGSIADAGWHHVLVTYDGGTTGTNIHVYFDGALLQEGTMNQLPRDSTDTIYIGWNESQGDSYNGVIDEIGIWNAGDLVLTDAQDLYNSGAGFAYPFTPPSITFPDVQSITETQFSSATTAHLVNMPASVSAGDLLMILFANNTAATITNPSGWTQKWNFTPAGNNVTGACFVKVAAGTEGGTTVDVVTSSAKTAAAQVYRIDNWHGSLSDIEVGTLVESGGLGTTPNPPSLTASWGSKDNLWIAATQYGEDDVLVSAYPANYGTGTDTVSGAGSNAGCSVGSAQRDLTTATEDPGTFTLAAPEEWIANTIVVRPLATGWAHKIYGITPEKIEGIDVANISKVMGVE